MGGWNKACVHHILQLSSLKGQCCAFTFALAIPCQQRGCMSQDRLRQMSEKPFPHKSPIAHSWHLIIHSTEHYIKQLISCATPPNIKVNLSVNQMFDSYCNI